MIEIKIDAKQFNPVNTFENGQCFRWEKIDDEYIGVVGQALISVNYEPISDRYNIECIAGEITEKELAYYFDLDTDYLLIENVLRKHDKWLALAFENIKGLRLLKQPPFEMLISFILSSNNNIPKIKMTIEDLCRKYGSIIGYYKDKPYYAFPTVSQLSDVTEASLRDVRAIGYRAKSVKLTVDKIIDEALDLDIPFMLDLNDGVEWLSQFYGVGEKVAHCILLFGYDKTDAYPIDTWVKKLLQKLYGVEDKKSTYQNFIKNYFTAYSGYAQQILFYYMRSFYDK